MPMQRNKHRTEVPCGSKVIIVTEHDEYEIEAVAKPTTPPPPSTTPPPPDYGISYVQPSSLEHIGVVTPGGKVDLTYVVSEFDLRDFLRGSDDSRDEPLADESHAWILYAVEDLGEDG